VTFIIVMLSFAMLSFVMLSRGAPKLMGENLKVVWAEFSTLSWAVLLLCKKCMLYTHMSVSKVENSAQVLS
jgi:hypothetical protein